MSATQTNPIVLEVDLGRLRKGVLERKPEWVNLRNLDEATGVNFGTCSRFLNGGEPSILTFSRFCAWLGVDPRDLYVTEKPRGKARGGKP